MKRFINSTNSSFQLTSVLEGLNPDIAEISDLISSDPKLSSFIMEIINSPLFGFEGKMADINSAIALLGIGQVIEILQEKLAVIPTNNLVDLAKKPKFFFNGQDAETCLNNLVAI